MKKRQNKKKVKKTRKPNTKDMVVTSTVTTFTWKEFDNFKNELYTQFKNKAKFAYDRLHLTGERRTYDIYVDKFSYNDIGSEIQKWIVDFVSKSENLNFA